MKKNKSKAFTVIELIIALFIVAVLSVLIIPKISKYFSEGKTKYYNSLENNVELSAKDYYSENVAELPRGQFDIYNNRVVISKITFENLASANSTTNKIVDSNGNLCAGYVLVENIEGEYNYHTCLFCEADNYNTNDDYCIKESNDKELPICSITYDKTKNKSYVDSNGKSWYKNSVLLTITGQDNTSVSKIKKVNSVTSIENLSLNNNTATYNATKNGEYKFYIYDSSLNRSECKETIAIDSIKPVISYKSNIEGEKLSSVSISVADNESGLNEWYYKYSKDGGVTFNEYSKVSNNSFEFTSKQPGDYVLSVKAIDNVGNEIEKKSDTYSIKWDVPQIVLSNYSITNKPVNVSIIYPGDGDIKQYKINQENWKTYDGEFIITSNCTVYAREINSTGEFGETVEEKVTNIDMIPPELVLSTTEIQIKVGTNYDLYSLITTKKDNLTASDRLLLTINPINTSFLGVGNYSVIYTLTDEAGNSTIKTLNLTIYNATITQYRYRTSYTDSYCVGGNVTTTTKEYNSCIRTEQVSSRTWNDCVSKTPTTKTTWDSCKSTRESCSTRQVCGSVSIFLPNAPSNSRYCYNQKYNCKQVCVGGNITTTVYICNGGYVTSTKQQCVGGYKDVTTTTWDDCKSTKTSTSWTSWSAWSTTPVSSSSSREVQTREVSL